jgi:hypothetical protein
MDKDSVDTIATIGLDFGRDKTRHLDRLELVWLLEEIVSLRVLGRWRLSPLASPKAHE